MRAAARVAALALALGLGAAGCAPPTEGPPAALALLTVALELPPEAPAGLATLRLVLLPAAGPAVERRRDLLDNSSVLFVVWVAPGQWLVTLEGARRPRRHAVLRPGAGGRRRRPARDGARHPARRGDLRARRAVVQ